MRISDWSSDVCSSDLLDGRDDVAAIVLTGADPAFCAGLDLKELAGGGDALKETGATGERKAGSPGPIPDMDTPVIGAVNGVAITGGFELALQCDFLIASDRARFADTHARVGIMPGWGLTVLLAEAIGRSEEHTSELQSLMRISYAVFCLNKK